MRFRFVNRSARTNQVAGGFVLCAPTSAQNENRTPVSFRFVRPLKGRTQNETDQSRRAPRSGRFVWSAKRNAPPRLATGTPTLAHVAAGAGGLARPTTTHPGPTRANPRKRGASANVADRDGSSLNSCGRRCPREQLPFQTDFLS